MLYFKVKYARTPLKHQATWWSLIKLTIRCEFHGTHLMFSMMTLFKNIKSAIFDQCDCIFCAVPIFVPRSTFRTLIQLLVNLARLNLSLWNIRITNWTFWICSQLPFTTYPYRLSPTPGRVVMCCGVPSPPWIHQVNYSCAANLIIWKMNLCTGRPHILKLRRRTPKTLHVYWTPHWGMQSGGYIVR